MKEKQKKISVYIISVLAALVLLYFSFRGVKWADFWNVLKNCRWEFVIVSMLAGVMSFWLRGLRWRKLLLPIDPDVKRLTAFNAVNIGYISNLVLPRIGEFVRCGVISGNSKSKSASYNKVLGTVILERGWDMLSMMFFLVILLIFRGDKFGAFFKEKMWNPISEKLSFSMWWIAAAAVIVCVVLIWTVIAMKDRSRFCSKVCVVFSGLMQGVGSCLKMQDKWKFFLYTLLIWGMYWLMSLSIMYAVPELVGFNVVDALFLMLAGSLSSLVPVPGGFGAFHFIVSLALSTIYGIPFEMGVIFATLSHESQTIAMILCGGASYACETVRKI